MMPCGTCFHLMIVNRRCFSSPGQSDRTTSSPSRSNWRRWLGLSIIFTTGWLQRATRHGEVFLIAGTVVASLVLSVVIYGRRVRRPPVLALPVTTMPIPEIAAGLIASPAARSLGHLGAGLHPPKTRRVLASRLRLTLSWGVVFAPSALEWLKLTANVEGMIAAACAAAFSAWWIAGLVIRVLRAYDKRA